MASYSHIIRRRRGSCHCAHPHRGVVRLIVHRHRLRCHRPVVCRRHAASRHRCATHRAGRTAAARAGLYRLLRQPLRRERLGAYTAPRNGMACGRGREADKRRLQRCTSCPKAHPRHRNGQRLHRYQPKAAPRRGVCGSVGHL